MRRLRAIWWMGAILTVLAVGADCTLDRTGRAPDGGITVGEGGAGGNGAACDASDDCPGNTACRKWACVDNACASTEASNDTICNQSYGDLCDGKGHCLKAHGRDCADGSECWSGNCVDEVCCESACEGPCQSCTATLAVGSCTPKECSGDM